MAPKDIIRSASSSTPSESSGSGGEGQYRPEGFRGSVSANEEKYSAEGLPNRRMQMIGGTLKSLSEDEESEDEEDRISRRASKFRCSLMIAPQIAAAIAASAEQPSPASRIRAASAAPTTNNAAAVATSVITHLAALPSSAGNSSGSNSSSSSSAATVGVDSSVSVDVSAMDTSSPTFAEGFVDTLYLQNILSSTDCALLYRAFEKEGIVSVIDILNLSKSDLKEMNMKIGARNRIYSEVNKLRHKHGHFPPQTPASPSSTSRDNDKALDDEEDEEEDDEELRELLSDDAEGIVEEEGKRRGSAATEMRSRNSINFSQIQQRPRVQTVSVAGDSSSRHPVLQKAQSALTPRDAPRTATPLAGAAAITPRTPKASPAVSSPSRPQTKSSNVEKEKEFEKAATKQQTPVLSASVASNASVLTNSTKDRELLFPNSASALPFQRKDEAYDVVKVNSRGRRQHRILKLCGAEIQNIKGKGTVTATHVLDDVFCVILAAHDQFVISYVNDHDFTYESPIAMAIVAEINERINERRTMDRENFQSNLSHLAIRYQEKLQKRKEKEEEKEKKREDKPRIVISEEEPVLRGRSLSESAVLADCEKDSAKFSKAEAVSSPPSPVASVAAASFAFAASPLKTATRTHLDASFANPAQRHLSTAAPALPASSSTSSTDSNSSLPSMARKHRAQTSKLDQMTGTTVDQRIQHSIDRYLLDSSLDEGRARVRFLKNFTVVEKEPHSMMGVVRQFMDSLRTYIEQKRGEHIKKQVLAQKASAFESVAPPDVDEDISIRIGRSVESAIVMPLFHRIFSALKKHTAPSDSKLQTQMRALRSRPQEWFGLNPDTISPTNWSKAVYELSFMERKALPAEKLAVLLDTARAIYNTYNDERNGRKREQYIREQKLLQEKAGSDADVDGIHFTKQSYYLSADEFFPIFVFVFVNSSVEFPECTKQYLWGLCDRRSLNGECGYYLTNFEALIEYVKMLDTNKASAESS